MVWSIICLYLVDLQNVRLRLSVRLVTECVRVFGRFLNCSVLLSFMAGRKFLFILNTYQNVEAMSYVCRTFWHNKSFCNGGDHYPELNVCFLFIKRIFGVTVGNHNQETHSSPLNVAKKPNRLAVRPISTLSISRVLFVKHGANRDEHPQIQRDYLQNHYYKT